MPNVQKPDEIQLLEGTWRNDRHGDPAERIIMNGEPVPPARLDAAALAVWNELVPPLVASGVAKAIDSAQLGAMCEFLARYLLYSQTLDEKNKAGKLKVGPASKGHKSCLLSVLHCWDAFARIAAQFGLTPGDRTKLRIPQTKPEGDGIPSRKRNA